MIEYRNGKKILITPISAEDLRDIHIGDMIWLTGSLTTGRDLVHRRVAEDRHELPVDLRGGAVYHAGPIVRAAGDGFEIVSAGPTTSMRMEKYEYEFVKASGVRLIVGKGGMKENTVRACREFGCIHCVFPAGNGVVAASCVERVERADWRDLGMTEALWSCRVREFGPLIVSIDAEGRNRFEEQKHEYNRRREEQLTQISKQVKFI